MKNQWRAWISKELISTSEIEYDDKDDSNQKLQRFN